MNEDSVIIDDDDVVMVEPVKIDGDNRITSEKEVIIDIVDLDDEPLATPTTTNPDLVNSSISNNHDTVIDIDNEEESSFVRILKNNTILNKIVQRCLNMTNNAGMSRVIHKTLLPLYKEADNKFKESEVFSTLLKTILRNLKMDPDHKFLYIKSLCEELKAGKYRRKVPFVTLTTDLRKNHTSVPSKNKEEDDNDSDVTAIIPRRNLKENKEEDDNDSDVTAIIPRRNLKENKDEDDNDSDDTYIIPRRKRNLKAKFKKYRNNRRLFNKRRKRRKAANKKSDVINLDNTDDESVITLDADDESDGANDIMILGKTDDNVNKINLSSQDLDDSSNNSNKENSQMELENDLTRSTNENHSVSKGLDESTSQSRRENTQIEAEDGHQNISSDDDSGLQTVDDNSNHSIEGNSRNKSENAITRPIDDLLVPQNYVEVEEHNSDLAKARKIEEHIRFCKKMIVKLEEKEVTDDFRSSPYLECDKFKAKIVALYKKLCEMTGSGDGNLMKQRVVRLHVAQGHPAGPVRCLEQFLNDSIDETGAVPLPDFHDVLQCVTASNIKDNLGWNRQQIMREALALFTHCGNALRKNRQKREYKDLLSLVRDKAQDDYDPANEDPVLLAKLEENKLIAKAKEHEIFERYSRMEYSSKTLGLNSINVTRTTPGGSGSDSTTDEESIPRKRLKSNTILVRKNVENKNLNAYKCPNKTLAEGNKNQILNETCITNDTRSPSDKEIIKSPTVTAIDNPLHNVLSCRVTQYPIPRPVELNRKAPIKNTLIIKTTPNTLNIQCLNTTENSLNPECLSFFTSIQNLINITSNNTLHTIENSTNAVKNLENTNTQYALNKTIQNALNTTQNSINTIPSPINTTQNLINTTNTINATTQNARTPSVILNPVKNYTATNQIAWPDTLQKVGCSNRYVVAFDGKSTTNTEPEKIGGSNTIENNSNTLPEIRNDTVVTNDLNILPNSETEKTNDCNSIKTNVNNLENPENVEIKKEKVKDEPIDVQTLLDALGDNYISTIFDIEDPFLVIDISSDSSDDDL